LISAKYFCIIVVLIGVAMQKIKVSELFYSIQGEGRYMGVPSVFLRTFGCNFTCGGFGMPRGEVSRERDDVAANITFYGKYRDLPLVSTGCDSYASWDPRFKHLSPLLETEQLADKIVDLLPFQQWRDEHLVITGGEPLLGWQRAYPELLDHDVMRDLKELTFETNGTQPLSDDLETYLFDWSSCTREQSDLTFSISPKLSVSGEKWEDAIKPEVVKQYSEIGYTYLKFVIDSESDMQEVDQAVSEYQRKGFYGPVYLMPVGGVESVYSLNNRRVAELAMARGYRYSDRLQVPLFKNAWGT
jgi:organic radical activating enzyme